MRGPRHGFAALLCIILWGLGAPASADDYSNRVGITLGGGAYKLIGGAKDHAKLGPWAQTGLRFGWRRHWDAEATYRYGNNWDDTQNFRTTTTGIDLGVLWNQRPDAKWTLQAFGGPGVLWFNVVDFRGQASPGILDSGRDAFGFKDDGFAAALNGSNFKVYGGFGLEYFITHRLSVRGLVRLDYLIVQHIDNTGASDSLGSSADPTGAALQRAKDNVDANDLVPAGAITFTWFFGERDSDQDGIPNRLDKCPYDAEDKDGYQDEDGCPDVDNDADGVPDTSDKCVDTPAGVVVDATGCPKDSDADGVPDGPDQCPDTPAKAKVDAKGCPTDSDGDGVLDGIDTCELTPKGIPVDSTGCPMTMRIDAPRLLGGVGFEGATTKLSPGAYPVLDSLALALRAYPKIDLEIQGHVAPNTSKTKTPAMVKENDQKLSQARAEAIVEYLAGKGVDPTRLSPVGYGSEKPLESTDMTAADRNTRIVVAPLEAPAIEPLEPILPKKKE